MPTIRNERLPLTCSPITTPLVESNELVSKRNDGHRHLCNAPFLLGGTLRGLHESPAYAPALQVRPDHKHAKVAFSARELKVNGADYIRAIDT